jgi:uncharacterized cupredoxin-like copper-binding protein
VVSTVGDADQAAAVAASHNPALSIVGTLATENLGVERLFRNTTTSVSRYLCPDASADAVYWRHHVPRSTLAGVVVAVVVLAGLSTLAVGATAGGFRHHNSAYGPGGCSAPALPGSAVNVVLSDMGVGMMGGGGRRSLSSDPRWVVAGRVSFVARNVGGLVHELVVLPLADGSPGIRKTGSDNKVDESASLGEASKSCSDGVGSGLVPGSIGWITVTLTAGRYELVCDMPGHYASGMYDVLTVR